MIGRNNHHYGMMMSQAWNPVFSNQKRELTWLRNSIVVPVIATRMTCPIEGCVWGCEWVETEFWHCQWCWWMTACVSVDMLRTLVKWLGLPINMDQTSAWLGESCSFEKFGIIVEYSKDDIDGIMQERRNSIANALELRLSCSNPLILNWRNIMASGKSAIFEIIFCDIMLLPNRQLDHWIHVALPK